MRSFFLVSIVLISLVACNEKVRSTSSTGVNSAAQNSQAKVSSPRDVPKARAESDSSIVSSVQQSSQSAASATTSELSPDNWPSEVRGDPNILSCKRTDHDANAAEVTCKTQDVSVHFFPDRCSAKEGSYGEVDRVGNASSVKLYQHLDATAERGPALPVHQLLCTTATARIHHGDKAVWYFVRAINPMDVPACAQTKLESCAKSYIKLPAACKPDQKGQFGASCPSGWISADEYVEYSMGL